MIYTIYKNGIINTLFGVGDTVTGHGIDIKQLGLYNEIAGFTDKDGINKVANFVLSATGFKSFDKFTKCINVNSRFKKLKGDIKNNNLITLEELDYLFSKTEIEQFKKDVLNNNLSENVLQYLLINLSEVQPITIDSRTALFLNSKESRWLYIFKQYSLKIFSTIKQDIINNFRKGDYKNAFKNLATIQLLYYISGGVGIGIKELFSNIFDLDDDEDETIGEFLLSGFLVAKVIGLHNFKKTLDGDLGYLIDVPLLQPLKDLAIDIKKLYNDELDFKDSKLVRYIPYVKDIQKYKKAKEGE